MAALTSAAVGVNSHEVSLNMIDLQEESQLVQHRKGLSGNFDDELDKIDRIDRLATKTLLESLSSSDPKVLKTAVLSPEHIQKLNDLNEKIFGTCGKTIIIATIILSVSAGLPCLFNDRPIEGFVTTVVIALLTSLFALYSSSKGQREAGEAQIDKHDLYPALPENPLRLAKNILYAYQCDIVAIETLRNDPEYRDRLNLLEPQVYAKNTTSEEQMGKYTEEFMKFIQKIDTNFEKLKEISVLQYKIPKDPAKVAIEPLRTAINIITQKEGHGKSFRALNKYSVRVLTKRIEQLKVVIDRREHQQTVPHFPCYPGLASSRETRAPSSSSPDSKYSSRSDSPSTLVPSYSPIFPPPPPLPMPEPLTVSLSSSSVSYSPFSPPPPLLMPEPLTVSLSSSSSAVPREELQRSFAQRTRRLQHEDSSSPLPSSSDSSSAPLSSSSFPAPIPNTLEEASECATMV